jgi:hypothetical protein
MPLYDDLNRAAISLKFIQHFLSLLPNKINKDHVSHCPIMIWEDSTYLDEEHDPKAGNGPTGEDARRGTV